MDTAIITIIVSSISVCVAVLSVGWKIHRDVKSRPRVTVSLNVVSLPDFSGNLKYLSISGMNVDQVPITVDGLKLKKRSLWRKLLKKPRYADVIPDFGNPLSDRLPKRLEGGDNVRLHLPYDANCFLQKSWSRVGLQTSFGKTYWSKPRDVNRARQLWLKDFGNNRTQPPHIRS